MKRISLPGIAIVLSMIASSALAQSPSASKKVWSDRLLATNAFLQQHMWNPNTGNFVRRSDMSGAAGSDAWGITIMLDAYAYMVQEGFMKPEAMKHYFVSSSALYEKTGGASGARIIARQGDQVYVGGDDDLQWIAALVHDFQVTRDTEYLNTARNAFNALIDMGFWKQGSSDNPSRGWAWNSSDQRPNGVSTAYGALAAARLYQATGEQTYKEWAAVSLNALATSQVGFFPRDMMVAANAATVVYEVSKQHEYLSRAQDLARVAMTQVEEVISGKRQGERNPTDVGDCAEGFARLYEATHTESYLSEAERLVQFFLGNRSDREIAAHGFYSRYDAKGNAVSDGAYLGVPLTVDYLPEVAEMLKLCAVAYQYF